MLRAELEVSLGGLELAAAFDVEPGQCLALAGPSGAGKTTILRMLAGLTRPDSGRVELDGRTLFDGATRIDLAPEERRLGMVFQDYALFEHVNVWRNVAFGLRGARRQRRTEAVASLQRLGIEQLAERSVDSLSGGERQRLALARAVATDPQLLLLDEPLSALDVRSRAHAAGEITRLTEELRVPTVVVTHDFQQAALLGQSIAVLEDGEILQRGRADELAAAPASAFVAEFTGTNILRGEAAAAADGLTVVALEGGGELFSVERAEGAVFADIGPWEVSLRAERAVVQGSERNALPARVSSLTPAGNRLRAGLALPQPLVAEVSHAAAAELDLAVGKHVTAVFKAAAVRLHTR